MIRKARKPLQFTATLGLILTGALYAQPAKSMQPNEPYVNCYCSYTNTHGHLQQENVHVDLPCSEESCESYCKKYVRMYRLGEFERAWCWDQIPNMKKKKQ